MTESDAAQTPQKLAYVMSALDLMRARIEDLRGEADDANALLFLGRNFLLVQELHRAWDHLTDLRDVPCPGEIWSWL